VLSKLITHLPDQQRAKTYLKYCHCATGGSDMNEDIQKIKESTLVLVGTVGRIRELSQHMDQNWLKKV
jgi:superfamily II DNA/RNA helicase